MPLVRAAQGDQPHSRVFGVDGKLHPNTAGALGLLDIRVLDALYVERYWRYVRTFVQPEAYDRFTGDEHLPRLHGNAMFDALGVRAVVSRRNLANVPGLHYLGRDRDTRVYEKTDAYPRAWVVHAIHRVDGEDDAFTFLESHARREGATFVVDTFNPRLEAVVEGASTDETLRSIGNPSGKCSSRAGDRVTVEHYSAESATLRVDAACSGLLVLPDTYYPGWRATVNGDRRTIHPTNGAFRGVVVPKGTSLVEFHYEPRAFPIGIAIALAGLVGFLAIAFFLSWLPSRKRGGIAASGPPLGGE
jgi:hypothetical protein